MAGLDPAIQGNIREVSFLALDGRLKGGHDLLGARGLFRFARDEVTWPATRQN
jgi:hypothetical protein